MVTHQYPRIVFLGTPEFAVTSLRALIENGYNVVAVVTAPDKPAGRGRTLKASEVKEYALSENIPILQPEKLKDPNFIDSLQNFKADLNVVVAFRMLPEVVWNMPPLGTLNVHGSLLPNYRGAAPINHAIINGETETGVSTFRLKHEIDTGNILCQAKLPFSKEDDFGSVYQKLEILGAETLLKTISLLLDGQLDGTPQDHLDPDKLHAAPKIFKEFTVINWTKNADQIHNLIRGLSPIPGAITTINDKQLKIYKATIKPFEVANISAGTIDSDGKSYLRFAASDAWVDILELQLEGKKRMDVNSFLRGYKI